HAVPDDTPLPNAGGRVDRHSRSNRNVGPKDTCDGALSRRIPSVSNLNTASQHGSRLDNRVVANRDQGAENGSCVQHNIVADIACVPT
ncbi:MAG: hypothetical protein ACJAZO_004134, partial [Myxococcota bacterium]